MITQNISDLYNIIILLKGTIPIAYLNSLITAECHKNRQSLLRMRIYTCIRDKSYKASL